MKLVTNGRLITRNADAQGYYEHGAVAFEGTKIVEVGEEAALRAKYPGAEIIDARGGVIMPAHAYLLRPRPRPFHRRQQPDELLRSP